MSRYVPPLVLGWILRNRKRWRQWSARRWSGGHYGVLTCQKSTVAALICQNDPPKEESFWQNNSLVTDILFELCLSNKYVLWYLVQSQIFAPPSKFKTCCYFKRAQNTILINCQPYFLILVSFFSGVVSKPPYEVSYIKLSFF